MPNKRDSSKSSIMFYIDRSVKQMAQTILEENGLTLTEYLTVSIYELIYNDRNEKIKMLNEMDGRTKKGKARIRNSKTQ